jgi:hypothetical protein
VNLDLIFPGQEIVVPLSTPTSTPTTTPLPTETATPQPQHPAPQLLSPAHGQTIDDDTVLLNWTSTGLLADDEFYVVQLYWPTARRSEYWLQNSSLRLAKEERRSNGFITWTVTVMRQTGVSPQGEPVGQTLSPPGQTRNFEWR